MSTRIVVATYDPATCERGLPSMEIAKLGGFDIADMVAEWEKLDHAREVDDLARFLYYGEQNRRLRCVLVTMEEEI